MGEASGLLSCDRHLTPACPSRKARLAYEYITALPGAVILRSPLAEEGDSHHQVWKRHHFLQGCRFALPALQAFCSHRRCWRRHAPTLHFISYSPTMLSQLELSQFPQKKCTSAKANCVQDPPIVSWSCCSSLQRFPHPKR